MCRLPCRELLPVLQSIINRVGTLRIRWNSWRVGEVWVALLCGGSLSPWSESLLCYCGDVSLARVALHCGISH